MTRFLAHYEKIPEELSIKEASAVTDYPAYTIRKAIKFKQLTAHRVGNQWIIPKIALKSYILSNFSISERDKADFL